MEEDEYVSLRNRNELAYLLSNSATLKEKRSDEWLGGVMDQNNFTYS